ncbi:MAG: Calcium-translocating P-type ATPase, PMCA-type [Parcubacteria group bacterium GW2011_GWA2_47_10b]|nr:MAG: Calcium-translocating P-type ATPase, PMCA-type [Parcubacteria group bacterium GW2011_GWA2_47_10b]
MTELWYAKSLFDIQKRFGVDPSRGLSLDEARKRIEEYGLNILPAGKKIPWWKLFFGQFANPLIIILLVAAALTFLINEYIDLAVILLAVFVNVSIGFLQEFRSNQIFEKLQKLVMVSARVLRAGRIVELDMAQLVPGDVIFLHHDMKVPADARLISAKNLLVNEAIITGESSAVSKNPGELAGTLAVGDRSNTIHMGTVIERGEGSAIVVATGEDTEIGKIAQLTFRVEDEKTPLQERLAKLGKILAFFMTFFSGIIFIFGLVEQKTFVEMFTVAVAVAVAAIPEGLPAALSVVLAVSASRILRKRGLVKKLIGAETLGSTTVIVTDKTGTLTKGTMVVERMLLARDEKRAARAMALASDVTFVGGFPKGEATDRAKVEYFQKLGGDMDKELSQFPRVAFSPFDQAKKILASFHRSERAKAAGKVFVSGAPETILALSRMTIADRKKVIAEVERSASQGFRLIAVAEGLLKDPDHLDLKNENILEKQLKNLLFLGIAAIRDPIREDVRESITLARKAGIRVIMATGDHKLTALAIGRELGFLGGPDSVLTGPEIDVLKEEDIVRCFKKIEIFSRVNPEHKMKLINTLREQGEVVAMTGDGVNDAPALKAADIGIALGSGSDVTKETADLVLLDDSFSIITSAIREGRIAFDNIRKVALFLLSNSFTEIIIILASLVFRTGILPITAVQILWANLVEDTFPNFALAFEPGERDIMERKPLKRREAILDRQALSIIFVVGILSDLLLTGLFFYLLAYSSFTPEHIQTLVFALLASNSLFIVFAVKSYRTSLLRTRILDNWYLIFAVAVGFLLLAGAVYAPFLQRFLGTVRLSPLEVFIIFAAGFGQVGLIELVKLFFRPTFAKEKFA